jgi:hypothetical protein
MMTMTRLDMNKGKSSFRRAAALPNTRVARDLVADWKRWSLPERILALVIVPLAALTVLAMSTALASGGH